MKLNEYKQAVNEHLKQINKNIADIENKVNKMKKLQSTFIKIDKNQL